MDEQEKEQESFSLEDILKEFGDAPEAEQEAEAPAQPQAAEAVKIWDGETPEEAPQETPLPRDTVRLDEISQAVKRQMTAEAEEAGSPAQEETPAPQPEAEEPYSEGWEPEYEQPMGEYIPPEPIVFRPKSRLRELKRKLVAGPEKRYYELTEQGFAKLQLAILGNLAIALISGLSAILYAAGAVQEDRLRLLIFTQFLSILLSALLGSYQLMEGFSDLIRRRFSLNTLLLFSLAACLADGILCLSQQRVPCCAAFSLNMTMSLWGAYQRRNTEMGQMDTMRKAIRLDSVAACPDYYEGRTGFLRGQGQVEDFMDTYQAPSGPEKTLNGYALTALFLSLGIGICAGVLHSVSMGVQVFSASLLVAVPASAYITLSRPMAVLERRLHKLGVVLCGWQGIRGLSVPGVFPLNDTDLFPQGCAKMNGVKFYGTRDPDQVIAYGTAVIVADGGGMAPLFTQLLDSRNGYHYEVETLRSYGNGGVGGIVDGEAVLVGSLSFMQEMGVDMPEGTRVSQAVYVAVDGSLCGVFAIAYSKVKSSAAGLTTLCAYRGLTPVLTTGDFMLTESFLRGKFGISTRRIAFPDRAARDALAARTLEEDAPALALTTGEGLAGPAYAVTGARALRTASILGVTVHMLGGILGLIIMLVLTILGADHLLTPANLVIYELIWMIPGLLVTEWTRSI
ncbi:MAG: hypothetical protein LUJ09_06220 [Firmicutes bacterium]|nr:hypothetical protein [Bacillota bacterium]